MSSLNYCLLLISSIFLFAPIYCDIEPADPASSAETGSKDGGVKTLSDAEVLASQGSAISDNSFFHAFIASLSVIIVSELGDKTFFIAAIMAMKHSRLMVWSAAIAALAMMHVMASFFGYATTVIPRVYTFYVSSALFAIFGLKMLHEGYHMSPNEGQEEFDEVNEELRKKNEKGDVETGEKGPSALMFGSKIFMQAFTMTFVAEWGDRSQMATVLLAAREDVYGVCVGGILGHALCTGLAVMGGKFIATRISVKTVTLTGGVVFILFALSALLMNPEL